MWLQFRSIVTFTWLEALRTRMVIFVALILVAAVLAAEFGSALAVTESREYRIAIYAGLTRLATVFVVAMFVTTSIVREFDDKILDLVLSRPVTRGVWFSGKITGYGVAAMTVAAIATVPLAVYGSMDAAVCWGISLMCELLIVVAACLTCLVTLSQITVALGTVVAFYILSRSMAAIALMSRGPTADLSGIGGQMVARTVEGVAFLLPDLDRFTNAAWVLAGPPGWNEFSAVLIQTLIYVALLFGVGLFDLYRRNF